MEPTEAEKRTARRAQLFLYALMAVMIALPSILFFARLR